jgi:starch synthase (maltosyl-transferring)
VTDRARVLEGERRRAVVEDVLPQVDGGRFAIKRCLGESVSVEADVFCDGHDRVRAVLRYRHEPDVKWREVRMQALGNDRFQAEFPVERLGTYVYTVVAWSDPFLSWRHDLERRRDIADIVVALQVGSKLLEEYATRAEGTDRALLKEAAQRLCTDEPLEERRTQALEQTLPGTRDHRSISQRAARERRPGDRALRRLVRDVSALRRRR